MIKAIKRTLGFINSHPLTKNNKLKAYKRLIKWQIGYRFNPYPTLYPFIEDSKLLVDKNMTGATGNIYTGLHEFEDMCFLLHFLREEDLMVDIGANVGSYTVLSSKVCKAKTISIEPDPSTYQHLINNIHLNNINKFVSAHNIGLSDKVGTISFTTGMDTVNHVISKQESDINNQSSIKVDTLDNICDKNIPALIKIDVEGYEKFVLDGAKKVLSNDSLKAIIIELNRSGGRYGIDEDSIHENLLKNRFKPFRYLPFSRRLEEIASYGDYNTIYLRDFEYVNQRLKEARKIEIMNNKV